MTAYGELLDTEAGDRRKHERVEVGLPARLWLDIGWQQVICEDVSYAGLGLTVFSPALSELLAHRREQGLPLRVTVQLSAGDLDLTGRLVYRSPERLGLELVELSPFARARLDAMLP